MSAWYYKKVEHAPPSIFETQRRAWSRSSSCLESLSEWRMSNFFCDTGDVIRGCLCACKAKGYRMFVLDWQSQQRAMSEVILHPLHRNHYIVDYSAYASAASS